MNEKLFFRQKIAVLEKVSCHVHPSCKPFETHRVERRKFLRAEPGLLLLLHVVLAKPSHPSPSSEFFSSLLNLHEMHMVPALTYGGFSGSGLRKSQTGWREGLSARGHPVWGGGQHFLVAAKTCCPGPT